MAELDDKKKKQGEQESSFREEYEKNEKKVENEEQQKGFFARLWEGIQKIFRAIGDFILALTHPDSVVYEDAKSNESQGDISKYFDSNKDEEIEDIEQEEEKDDVDILAAIEQDMEDKKDCNFFQNEDVVKFHVKVEKQNLDIMGKLAEMQTFSLNDSNKEYYASYIANIVEIINESAKNQELASITKVDNSPQQINFEIASKLPNVIEEFNKYAAQLTGDETVVISDEVKEQLAKMYVEKAKENFAKDIAKTYKKEGIQNVSVEDVVKEIHNQFSKVINGEIDEQTAYKNVFELTGIAEELKNKHDLEAEVEESAETIEQPAPVTDARENKEIEEVDAVLMDYDGYIAPPEEEIFVEEESKFDKILSTCRKSEDGRYIFDNSKTIRDLIKEIEIDPEEQDPEMMAMRNTLIQAERIVKNHGMAVWSCDSAEKYDEMPIGSSILENDDAMNSTVIIDEDGEHDMSTIINDEEEIGH